MMINNDKDNEFARTIIGMSQIQIKHSNVIGIYIQSYQNKKSNNIEVELITVVDKVIPNWEEDYGDPIYIKVRNMRVTNRIRNDSDFSHVYMHAREVILAQELKNSEILYDKEGKLKEYKKIYDKDNSLPLYANRIEISPKLMKRIKTGIIKKEIVSIPNTMATHYVNPLAMTAYGTIAQIKEILGRYCYESSDEFHPLDYVVCNKGNLENFQNSQKNLQNNWYKYDAYYAIDELETSKKMQPVFSTMERKEFYKQCLALLESQIASIDISNHLNETELRIYRELKATEKLDDNFPCKRILR